MYGVCRASDNKSFINSVDNALCAKNKKHIQIKEITMKKFENSIHMLKSVTGIQMHSFIITTADGKVVAIDGGFRQDADYFLEYLRELTGEEVPHIDAWFLSHAHCDHVDAFFEIMENKRDSLTVDKIYYNFPSIQFFSRGPRPDNSAVGTATTFYADLPLFADKICIVSEDDVYQIGEAKFEILYTPDPAILPNICNNSSTVIKMTLGGKTALFLGDCGIEAGDKILEKYKGTDMLRSDVCQMAHHGQNGVTREFYEAVRPEVCFWCAPRWLWDNDAGKGFNTHFWQTVIVRGWMEELGVKENYVIKDGTQVYSW